MLPVTMRQHVFVTIFFRQFDGAKRILITNYRKSAYGNGWCLAVLSVGAFLSHGDWEKEKHKAGSSSNGSMNALKAA